VLYVSIHQWPLYPGTGRVDERGGAGRGTTINLPMPAGSTGDSYLALFDGIVLPALERFDPTWVLVSAGFDAHRSDPLAGMSLSAGDFADMTQRLMAAVSPGRLILFLEGGYDLAALRASVASCVSALTAGSDRAEPASGGGLGTAAALDHCRAYSKGDWLP
jgi:acetoin utilization deacetylase AcuC-like enzyme